MTDNPDTAALVERLRNEVQRICTEVMAKRPGWRMSIPANHERDSDLIITDAIEALQRERDKLQTALKETLGVCQDIAAHDPDPDLMLIIDRAVRALKEASDGK